MPGVWVCTNPRDRSAQPHGTRLVFQDIHVLTNGRALTPTMLYSDPATLGWLAFSILEYFIDCGKVTWRHAECERRAQRGIGSTGQVA